MKYSIFNYVLFQVGWFSCVWGAANGLPRLGLIAVLTAVMLHLLFARRPGREALMLMICAMIGLVFDSMLIKSGWVSYPNGQLAPGLAPYWMMSLWVLFGTTLNLSMSWLRGRPWLGALLGFVGGPASYLAGERLGAMSMNQPSTALIALALGWGLAMPLLSALAARFDGFEPLQPPMIVETSWRDQGASGHV